MFESTIPFGEPELMRASTYRLYLADLEARSGLRGKHSRLASVSPSVRADLHRFEENGGTSEALEVLAACMRHAVRLTLHLQFNDRVVPLTVFPDERLVHLPLSMEQLREGRLTDLLVLQVEPALRRPPGDPERDLIADDREYYPLGPLLWDLAIRGARADLLPEIAGPAGYRVRPGLDLGGLGVNGVVRAAIARLHRGTHTLREIADFPGLNRERAARLLNALYLQAGLIVSRSHPEAIHSWFGSTR